MSRLHAKKINQFVGYKFPLFAFFYFLFALVSGADGIRMLTNGLILFVAYILIGFFGYFTNDMADVDVDVRVGKKNMAASLSVWLQITIAGITAFLGGGLIILWCPSVWIWMLAELFLLLMYSFPPFRLKEKGFLGVMADSLYAYWIPAHILLHLVNHVGNVSPYLFVVFPVLSFFIGIKNIIQHQQQDLDNDLISGIKTFTVLHPRPAFVLFEVSLWISILCWGAVGTFLFYDTKNLLYLCMVAVSILVMAFKIRLYKTRKSPKFWEGVPEAEIILYGFLIFWITLVVKGKWWYLLSFAFAFTPVIFYKGDKILKNGILVLIHKTYWVTRNFLSFIFNHSLYYTFLLLGVNLKEKAALANLQKLYVEPEKKPISSGETMPIIPQEKNVHALWIGEFLSAMELLTIKSFISNGYTFTLWLYNSLSTPLPEGCLTGDASTIISADKIFRYKYASQFGVGKGSVSGFSDVFRYKLLYEKGGWWVDMDVTCLKPFDVEEPYFFRSHHDLPLVGNIMKVPKGSELMRVCYETASREIDENNRDWHKPINILVENVMKLGLDNYIVDAVSNTDEWNKVKQFVTKEIPFPSNWYFVHWCNEVWRTNGYSKNKAVYHSNYGHCLRVHGLLPYLPVEIWKKHDKEIKWERKMEALYEWL